VTELQRGTGRRGVVVAFDETAGLGVIAEAAGREAAGQAATGHDGAEFPFHCIEIGDGSRSIDVGTEVTFDVVAKLGRWEAANIRS
jgi:CspA family cold shock protein